ncbi:MAG TPA: VWA domain-containing protein [Mycobacteriales bacterium]|nr:VWA domain-containing protein [Mycobacteriales bacterium]
MARPDDEIDPVVTLARFARALRASGVAVDPARVAAMVEAIACLDAANPSHVYWAGRATVCGDPDDLPRYDALFDEWFLGIGRIAGEPPKTVGGVEASIRASIATGRRVAGDDRGELGVAASDAEQLRHRDVTELDVAELEAVGRFVSRLAPRAGLRRTQRRRPGAGRDLDVARTVRAFVRDGGELRRPARRGPRARPRRVLFLIDVSGSMSPYADLLLRFAHAALRRSPTRIEVFTVGTRLTRVTRQLRCRDPEEALRAAGEAIPDWSGGTRLGETLQAFLDRWGQRGTARQAVVVIASDGWERGDATLLGAQMARLKRLAHRITWVNPHAGRDGFAPLATGMAVALPHVDDLVSGHSLDAFERLAATIAR